MTFKFPAIASLAPTYCEPVVVAFPATCKLPPRVTRPAPMVTGRLFVVFIFKVPEAKSITGLLPVKLMAFEAIVEVAALLVNVPLLFPMPILPETVERLTLPVVTFNPPPKVTNPEPNVTGRLFKVLKLNVPDCKSKLVEPPVREIFVEATVVVAPLIRTLPPKVKSPVPVVTGRLVTVLRNRVEPVVKSMTGFVPVRLIFEANVVVFVTVRLLIVVVARVELLPTLNVPLIN